MKSPRDPHSDIWTDWLLHRRHADDADYERHVRSAIERFADRVLDGAQLAPDMTVADIGSGDGLVAFRAIARVGSSLRVILTDISASMLLHCEEISKRRGINQQCTFLQCSAEKLDHIPNAAVDVVTTRAVLAYVTDKCAALGEFLRILKPGGRLSIAEPVFRDDAFEAVALKNLVDSNHGETLDRFLPLLHRWKSAQFPDTEQKMALSPITNYSERDLVRFVHDCGFAEIRMAFHIDILPSIITSWNAFLLMSPHPWAPCVETILTEQFTQEERQLFEKVLRPAIEDCRTTTTERVAYLTAVKPQ